MSASPIASPIARVEALRREYAALRSGEYAAVAVLLAEPRLSYRHEFTRHVTRHGIDWDALVAEPAWSTTQRFVIESAMALWRGSGEVNLALVASFDDFYGLWQAMIAARRTGRVPAAYAPNPTTAPAAATLEG